MENQHNIVVADNPSRWVRVFHMALLIFLLYVAEFIMWMLVGISLVVMLVTGSSNERLRDFGKQLSTYVYSLTMFLTYNNDQKPFPFSDWPK
ncbi:MAG: DUF4389 domain-containing protein [Gammaproteobacteria bacterium]|nr:DUF4389 domain-containing protein [Gammaproteobacteria bacterium]